MKFSFVLNSIQEIGTVLNSIQQSLCKIPLKHVSFQLKYRYILCDNEKVQGSQRQTSLGDKNIGYLLQSSLENLLSVRMNATLQSFLL